MPWIGAPRSRSTTAGAGLGSTPCAARTIPVPVGHRAGPDLVDPQRLQRRGRADHVDDRVEAADLVEVDLFRRPPVEPALGLGQRPEGGEGAVRAPGGGSLASSTRPVMWAAVRTTPVSATRTSTLVAAMPQRSTGSTVSSQPSTGSRPTSPRTSSGSAPASISAPSAMSPAIPEKQWNQATVRALTSASAAPRRRRRSRCRCPRRSGRRRTTPAWPAARSRRRGWRRSRRWWARPRPARA